MIEVGDFCYYNVEDESLDHRISWTADDDDDPRCWSLYPTNRDLQGTLLEVIAHVGQDRARFRIYGTDIEFVIDCIDDLTPVSPLVRLALEG